jgi:hypothetical protein
MQWLADHWKDVVLAILAIDAALMPLFPDNGILKKIKDVLTPVAK